MDKKFSELKAGDSVWIWWLNELYEYGVQDISTTRRFMLTNEGEKELSSTGDRHLLLKGGGAYYLTKECGLTLDGARQQLKSDKAPDRNLVDDAFSCYNVKVTVRQTEALGDE